MRLFASFYSNPLDPDELLESLGIKQFELPAAPETIAEYLVSLADAETLRPGREDPL